MNRSIEARARGVPPVVGSPVEGLGLGLLAVLLFGLTLPFTRLAVAGHDPLFVSLGRAVLAALLAAVVLAVMRPSFPPQPLWGRLLRYSLGVVLGFPLLATLAMKHAPAAHGGVILAVLPLATAMASVPVAGERPSLAFWLWGALGSALVLVYAVMAGGGAGGLHIADLLLFAAVASAAWGYAEGGVLARHIGGWQAISWALVVSAPVMLAALWLLGGPINWQAPVSAWAGFFYVSIFSMFIGFFAWNRALALGGIARIGQLQLLQTFVTLAGAALLNGERVGPLEIGFAVAVVAVVAAGWRTRVGTRSPAAVPGDDRRSG